MRCAQGGDCRGACRRSCGREGAVLQEKATIDAEEQEVPRRPVIRTKDVFQTNVDDGVVGYSDKLLSVVAHFRNNGAPEGFNAQSMAGKSKKGAVALRLFAVIDPDANTFERVGFKARGCLAMTACASMICMMLEGRSLEEALSITPEALAAELDGVPAGKGNTTVFAVEAVRALVGDYLIRQGASVSDLDRVVPCDQDSTACLMCEHCSLRSARVDLAVDEAVAKAKAGGRA